MWGGEKIPSQELPGDLPLGIDPHGGRGDGPLQGPSQERVSRSKCSLHASRGRATRPGSRPCQDPARGQRPPALLRVLETPWTYTLSPTGILPPWRRVVVNNLFFFCKGGFHINYFNFQKLKGEGFLYWTIQGEDAEAIGELKPRQPCSSQRETERKGLRQTRFLSPGAEQEEKDSNCSKREFIYK